MLFFIIKKKEKHARREPFAKLNCLQQEFDIAIVC